MKSVKPFQIKICGITRPQDALWAVGAGADAVGLNFYSRSPRYIWPEDARHLITLLPGELVKVGVFVNADPAEIWQIFEQLGLDWVQLHGDEPPMLLQQLGGLPIIRAFRLGPEGLQPVLEYLERCRYVGRMPDWVLLEGYIPGQYGGTGHVAQWDLCREYAAAEGVPPLVLAGGLNPANVGEAIRSVRPTAVDTASGVELSPGRKDPSLVAEFIRAAREAFQQIQKNPR
ncbi:MAG: phosphoribosylanthranilate isomerase [Thermoguttaceae bacterium]|nr:phosphoribosylanthranilate isomerase [Thermoguttaceae bacterium]MDW8038852.1 phosphoribosylanthranilate isomerase [Thermoguttaceae bacterium]